MVYTVQYLRQYISLFVSSVLKYNDTDYFRKQYVVHKE